MDWTRARVILIFAFTAVNLMLAYLLWVPGMPGGGAAQLAPHQVREVRTRLDEQGVHLRTEIPTQRPTLRLLRVSQINPQTRQELLAIFRRLDPEHGRSVQEDLDGWIALRPPVPIPAGDAAITAQQAKRSADLFIEGSGFLRLYPLRLSRTYALSGNLQVIEYVPLFNGMPVFVGQVKLVLGAQGWEQISAYLPSLQDERGEGKEVLAATEALLRLVGHVQTDMAVVRPARIDPPLAITDISLGYYAGLPNQARAWDTVPTWRMVADTGAVYYINAYTGELEKILSWQEFPH